MSFAGDVETDGSPEDPLSCDECGEEVTPAEALLCICGKGLCASCIVLGAREDTCPPCADRATVDAAIARGEHLTLLQGGAA